MNTKKNIADTAEMEKRRRESKEFYNAILDPYEHPWLVTDEASLYDITLDDEEDLIKRISDYYGITIDKKFIGLPFWKLLDYLEKSRIK